MNSKAEVVVFLAKYSAVVCDILASGKSSSEIDLKEKQFSMNDVMSASSRAVLAILSPTDGCNCEACSEKREDKSEDKEKTNKTPEDIINEQLDIMNKREQ